MLRCCYRTPRLVLRWALGAMVHEISEGGRDAHSPLLWTLAVLCLAVGMLLACRRRLEQTPLPHIYRSLGYHTT